MFLPSNITLKFGDSGDFVAELQRRLAMVGCFDETQVNGFFDGPTTSGVTRFQSMNSLHADGVAGPETLRRLNGVIAGDSSSGGTSSNQEEEAKIAQTTSVLNQWAIDQPLAGDPALLSPAAPAAEAAVSTLHVPSPQEIQAQAMAAAPPPVAPAPPPMDHAILHAPLAPVNDLASMLLNQPPPQPMAQMAPPPLEHARPPMQETPPVQQFQPIPSQPQPLQQQERPPVAEQPAQEQQGLIGKTVRFANAMMQKIADYFEAKLPPSVLKEVQNIGASMSQHGVKEAPIPTGPEMGGPAQAPARGPEQQPGIQRG